MKTINFLKTALLTIALFVYGNVWGETATSNFLSSKTTDAQIVENGKTITYQCSSRNNYENPARIYQNSTLTISSTDNSIITQIEFTSPSDKPLTGFTANVGEYNATKTNATWTGESTSIIFTANSQVRVQNIIVTYTPATAASVATPTFSVQTGKYTEAQSVTINCATAEASIYYTLDETEPSELSTPYNGAINISSTTTLKAIAIKNGESSAVATATYTFPTEVDDIAAFNQAENNDFVKITNPITVTYINGANVYAQDESGSMLIYDFNFAETEGLTNGSIINNITGENTLYNGAPQMKNVFSYTLSEHISIINPTTVETLSTADVHKYVKLEDAQFDNSYSFTESSNPINANLSTHGNIIIRNNFRNLTMDVNSTDKYDIVGFVSVYNNAPQIYPISIVVTTPSITVSTNSLAFETVENNQTKDLTFTVNGANLSENATLAIAGGNADYFTCNPTSITPAEDGSIAEETITVTYQPTATGEHAATLTLTCGDLVKEIALTGTCINPMLATPVATEATAITDNGFTANWEAVENATSYEVNVWTSQEVFNEDFSEIEAGNNTSTSGSSSAWDGNANFTNINKVYQAGEAIKLGSSDNPGLITTKELELTGSDVEVLFDVKGWTGVEGDIKITIGEASQTISYEATINDAFESKSVLFQNVTANTITIATTAKRAFIDNIVIIKKENIADSPFTVEGATSKEITGLTAETTYYYNVVAKAEGYTASEASNTISVTTTAEVAEPTITITGDDLVETEGMYTVALGDTKFSTKTSKTFTLTATGITESIKIKPEIMSGYFTIISSDSEQASIVEDMDFFGNVNKTLTFTPNETGEINAVCTISNRTDSEFADYGISNGEEMLQMFDLTFGTPLTEQWGILYQNQTANITKVITVSLTPTEESTGTGLCNQPEMEGVTFNGEEIINSLNLDVVVYNAVGQMVVRSNENINMSSYPAGVYVIKAANGASMKIVK